MAAPISFRAPPGLSALIPKAVNPGTCNIHVAAGALRVVPRLRRPPLVVA